MYKILGVELKEGSINGINYSNYWLYLTETEPDKFNSNNDKLIGNRVEIIKVRSKFYNDILDLPYNELVGKFITNVYYGKNDVLRQIIIKK